MPEYEGSDKFDVNPFPIFSAEFGERVSVDITGVTVDLYEANGFRVGVKGGYEMGRKEDDSDYLRGLGDIDPGGVIGGIVSYDVGPFQAYAKLDKTIGGSDGLTGTVGAKASYKYERFAVHLAHRHFVLGLDEILIERPDPDGRTQHVTVGRLSDEAEARPTTWLFDDRPELLLSAAVYCVCVSDPDKTEACIRHGKSRSPGGASQKDEAAKERRISEEKGGTSAAFRLEGMTRGGHAERLLLKFTAD